MCDPDLRCGLEIADLGEALAQTEFQVFRGLIESGGVVRGINAGARDVTRRELDELTEYAKRFVVPFGFDLREFQSPATWNG